MARRIEESVAKQIYIYTISMPAAVIIGNSPRGVANTYMFWELGASGCDGTHKIENLIQNLAHCVSAEACPFGNGQGSPIVLCARAEADLELQHLPRWQYGGRRTGATTRDPRITAMSQSG